MNWLLWVLLSVAIAVFGMARYGPSDAPRLLGQRVRNAIMSFLQHKPGSSITSICRSTGIAWGTAQHHLYLLGKAELVKSVAIGRSRAFFPGGIDQQRQNMVALLRQEPTSRIARAIHVHPDSIQKELLLKIGMTRKVFRHHMNLLVAAGLVVESRGPKTRNYGSTPTLKALIDDTLGMPLAADFAAAPAGAEGVAGSSREPIAAGGMLGLVKH